MKCSKIQTVIVSGTRSLSGPESEHLQGCEECSRFARRFELVENALRDHHARAEPDPAFAARVASRLPAPPPMLGWAALRLLPATLALAIVLSAWAWIGNASSSDLVAMSPTDDLLSWVLEDGGGE